MIRAEYKGYKIEGATLTLPNGDKLDLTHQPDRRAIKFKPYGHKMTLYRVVVCILMGMDSMPSSLEVHHVDLNADNCDPANLVLLTKSAHIQAHTLVRNMTLACVRGDFAAGWQAREEYVEFVKNNNMMPKKGCVDFVK